MHGNQKWWSWIFEVPVILLTCFFWSGRQMDFGARYYDPSLGIWHGVDPIGERFPHLTPYNYADNSPVSYIDFHGLQATRSRYFYGEITNDFGQVDGEGFIQSSTAYQREHSPFKAGVADATHLILTMVGLDGVDNAFFGEGKKSTSEKVFASINFITSVPSKGKSGNVKNSKAEVVASPKASNDLIYDTSNKKHSTGGHGTLMDLDNVTAQSVLENSTQVGKQRYGYNNKQIYEFKDDNAGKWHGYTLKGSGKKAPTEFLRELKKNNVITNAEYTKLVNGKDL